MADAFHSLGYTDPGIVRPEELDIETLHMVELLKLQPPPPPEPEGWQPNAAAVLAGFAVALLVIVGVAILIA